MIEAKTIIEMFLSEDKEIFLLGFNLLEKQSFILDKRIIVKPRILKVGTFYQYNYPILLDLKNDLLLHTSTKFITLNLHNIPMSYKHSYNNIDTYIYPQLGIEDVHFE